MTAAMQAALRVAASRLADRQSYRLVRDGGTAETVWLPPALTMLADRAASSDSGAGGGTSPKSKPPVNVVLLDLKAELDDVVTDAVRSHDLQLRYRAILEPPYFVHDVALNLRQLVPALIDADPDDEVGLLTDWAERLAGWLPRVQAALGDTEEGSAVIPVTGGYLDRCPDCGTKTMWQTDETGEKVPRPAVVAVLQDFVVRHVMCLACGATWHRGVALDQLVDDVRTGAAASPGVYLGPWIGEREVYLPGGRRRHVAPRGDTTAALCRVTPEPRTWLGAGSEAERDTAQSLPLCSSCETYLRARNNCAEVPA